MAEEIQDYDDTDEVIFCPRCRHEQELHVVPTVNVTVDPDMRKNVLSGDIFKFTCSECGFVGLIAYPFLYEDKETKGGFLIYLEPDCSERSVNVYGDIADQVLLQNMTMRLVTSIRELKEKIFIFEAGLDDRVIELFKMLVFSKMRSDGKHEIPDELWFSDVSMKDHEKTLTFVAFKGDVYKGVLELPYILYQSCIITGSPIWDYPVTECGKVDKQWILDRMKEDTVSECQNTGLDECKD